LASRFTDLTVTCLHLPNRQKDREEKAFRRQAFLEAFHSKKNTLSLRKLAKKHGLSFPAAQRLTQKETVAETLPGRSNVLPLEIEALLVKSLLNCAKNACAIKMVVFPKIVVALAAKYGHDCRDFVAGPKWLKGFLLRNPEVSKRMPSKTNQGRLTHWNRIAWAEWTAAVGPLLKLYKPEEIWNMDDTSFDLETVKGKVSASINPLRDVGVFLTHSRTPPPTGFGSSRHGGAPRASDGEGRARRRDGLGPRARQARPDFVDFQRCGEREGPRVGCPEFVLAKDAQWVA
jgi:hypothetical protein